MKHQASPTAKLSPSIVTAFAAMCFLSACATNTNTTADAANVEIDIPFDANGCPRMPADIDADKSMRIVWQSVDATTKADINEEYQIFFDPFVGKPQKSDANGRLRSLPFNNEVPPTLGASRVEYKYTIVGARFEDKPLDPRLWLRR